MADEKDIETNEAETAGKKPAAKPDAADKPAAKAKAKPAAKKPAAKADAAEKPAAKAKAKPAAKKPAAKADAADKPAGKAEPAKPKGETAKPAAAAKAKAAGNGAVGERPVVRAQARYVRSSARKARLVCDHIRGKSVEEARAILAFAPRQVARDWAKLLESAVANAEHNHELDGDDLKVLAVYADEGPTIKRFRPRAQGRATRILKRTSHLTIQLTPKG